MLYKIKSLRAHSAAHFLIKKYNSHISHALLRPSSTASEPSRLSKPPQPTFFTALSQAPLSHSQRVAPLFPTSVQQITPILKKYIPYLETESENILTLTLSQAPAFVRFYICTQSPNAAIFLFFVGMSGFHSSPAPLENTVSASD